MVAVERICHFMQGKSAPRGRVLARIAYRQHGVISRGQILAIGFDRGFIERAIVEGRLHPIHAGVYAVGHARLSQDGVWVAAVLSAGEHAALSYLSAAQKLGIVDRYAGLPHVTVQRGHADGAASIILHRTRELPADHRTERDGIPLTSPHRTLVDLAAILPARRLRFAVEAADRLGLLDVAALVALCDASAGRRGVGRLRRIAQEQRGAIARTKSRPERLFLKLCLKRGLPEPRVNARLEGYEVDFYWPDAKLVVEIDSYTFHRSWPQIQRDHERDAHLKVCGHDVLRYTEQRLRTDEDGAFGQIGTLLARVA